MREIRGRGSGFRDTLKIIWRRILNIVWRSVRHKISPPDAMPIMLTELTDAQRQ